MDPSPLPLLLSEELLPKRATLWPDFSFPHSATVAANGSPGKIRSIQDRPNHRVAPPSSRFSL
ncbi:hypothetical protein [Desulfogranum mediterraneum]|uniref:hypothetical protein n=1 Tax=Desulfogranum mediterraneum TaxID=160661 RepID=UPI00040FF6ED|nr:hypothetical protein [Desulfogranum mediterraneum]